MVSAEDYIYIYIWRKTSITLQGSQGSNLSGYRSVGRKVDWARKHRGELTPASGGCWHRLELEAFGAKRNPKRKPKGSPALNMCLGPCVFHSPSTSHHHIPPHRTCGWRGTGVKKGRTSGTGPDTPRYCGAKGGVHVVSCIGSKVRKLRLKRELKL